MEPNLTCTNCGEEFNEPKHTYSINCPKCGHLLLIPSRRDWQALKDSMSNT